VPLQVLKGRPDHRDAAGEVRVEVVSRVDAAGDVGCQALWPSAVTGGRNLRHGADPVHFVGRIPRGTNTSRPRGLSSAAIRRTASSGREDKEYDYDHLRRWSLKGKSCCRHAGWMVGPVSVRQPSIRLLRHCWWAAVSRSR
jgi:hypothetical protein